MVTSSAVTNVSRSSSVWNLIYIALALRSCLGGSDMIFIKLGKNPLKTLRGPKNIFITVTVVGTGILSEPSAVWRSSYSCPIRNTFST